jgi:hypothetical protein
MASTSQHLVWKIEGKVAQFSMIRFLIDLLVIRFMAVALR